MKDRIVENVVKKYQERSAVGIQKYGTTLEQNNKDNYFIHAQQEAMDFTLYVEKLIDIVKSTPHDEDLGKIIRRMVMGNN